MNKVTREQARRNIVALGLPQIVLDAFDGKRLPYNLDLQFRYPYQVLDSVDQQQDYGIGRITPVWTGNSDDTIVAYHHDPLRAGFFRFDIETGEEAEPVRMNWQQVLVHEFKILWEAEMPDDRLREVAGWFCFKHIEEIT
ncbi:MAG TPA: hypothetical protein VFE62_23300, partial [Gemmataceae bacterium]|nr:hypothetical protein [Gemmataceae bacterium]